MDRAVPSPEPVLVGRDLHKSYVRRRNILGSVVERTHALRGVSLDVRRGETHGIVGESGSGKSTLARLLLRLESPDEGTVHSEGQDLAQLDRRHLRRWRRRAQMVFQDPFASLDPMMVIGDSVGEAITVHERVDREERDRRVLDLLERVGMRSHHMHRFPAEFSGGQLQRVAIARALATDPDVIVCDEPVAALDVSIRAQVLNLLRELQDERGIAIVFITHDLSLVRVVADRISVMYSGRIVETGRPADIFGGARHPYTRTLLSAIPVPDPRVRKDRLPAAAGAAGATEASRGCSFAPRCPHVMEVCREEVPPLVGSDVRSVACHLEGETPVEQPARPPTPGAA